MENKKGAGIFLGVVSVATLIVAIIGATFAYFSATVTGTNTVDVSAYEFNATMVIEPIYPMPAANGIIPINPAGTVTGASGSNTTNMLYALNVGGQDGRKCVDSNGYQVCALYKVTVTNGSKQALTLAGTIVPITNNASSRTGATPFMNLKYQVVSGDDTQNNLTLVGTAADFQKAEVVNEGDLPTILTLSNGATPVSLGTNLTVPAATESQEEGHEGELKPQSSSMYVLLYLNDNGDQSSEMGATFQAQITFASTNGEGGQLTGTFTVQNNEP